MNFPDPDGAAQEPEVSVRPDTGYADRSCNAVPVDPSLWTKP